MKRASLLAGAALTVFHVSFAMAADVPNPDENLKCGDIVAATKQEIVEATRNTETWSGLPGTAGEKTIVWRTKNEGFSTLKIATLGMDKKWTAQFIAEQSSLEGARQTSDGALALFAMWSSGDPGQSYTVVVRPNATSRLSCNDLAFPKELNQPQWAMEYLSFSDFNGVAGGDVALIGKFETSNDNVPKFGYYRYESKNGGSNWSPPTGITGQAAPLKGAYMALPTGVPAAILEQLPTKF